jgi:excisionase family DNA binding protein
MDWKFDWKESAGTVDGVYRECSIDLTAGKLIRGVRARVQQVEEKTEWTEDAPRRRTIEIADAFYPALDIVVSGQFLRVAGGFRGEVIPKEYEAPMWYPSPEEPSADSRPSTPPDESTKADSDVDQAMLRQAINTCAALQRLVSTSEDSLEKAESTLRRYVKELVANLREDSQTAQEILGGDILTVTEVAELFGVPRNTVLNWIKAGSLNAFRFGAKWMIRRQDLVSAMEQSRERRSKQ